MSFDWIKNKLARFAVIFILTSILMAVFHAIGMVLVKYVISPRFFGIDEMRTFAIFHFRIGFLVFSMAFLIIGGPMMLLIRARGWQNIWAGLTIGLITCLSSVVFIHGIGFEEGFEIFSTTPILPAAAANGLLTGSFLWWAAYRSISK